MEQRPIIDTGQQRPCGNGHWITPPEVYKALDDEFHFDFDPCPYPRPLGWDALSMKWGNMNFVNPPFRRIDGVGGGPTAFVRKAIRELAQGRSSVILLPVPGYVNLLLEAGASIRSMGRVRWLNVGTKEPQQNPSPIARFVLGCK